MLPQPHNVPGLRTVIFCKDEVALRHRCEKGAIQRSSLLDCMFTLGSYSSTRTLTLVLCLAPFFTTVAVPHTPIHQSYVSKSSSLQPCVLQEIVETSMLAAISGLLFLITVTLGIDGSFLFAYMLPFPIVMAALRRTRSAGMSVMWVSSSLLLSALPKSHLYYCPATHINTYRPCKVLLGLTCTSNAPRCSTTGCVLGLYH